MQRNLYRSERHISPIFRGLCPHILGRGLGTPPHTPLPWLLLLHPDRPTVGEISDAASRPSLRLSCFLILSNSLNPKILGEAYRLATLLYGQHNAITNYYNGRSVYAALANNLPKVVSWKRRGQPAVKPATSKSHVLIIRPPCRPLSRPMLTTPV